MSRSVTSLLDLTGDEVRALAAAARDRPARTAGLPSARALPLLRKVVAVLAFGPEDPPPAAWIAAVARLGGTAVRETDLGEAARDPFAAVAEAARWADVLVVSHPLTGFARAVAETTRRPVVNAAEGGGECPAAGIALLAATWPEGPPILARRLRAAVCGEIAESRSARAFLAALAAVDATVLLVPARGHELSEDDVQRLARRVGRAPHRFEAHAMSSLLDMVDTVLLGADTSAQLPLFEEVGVPHDEALRRARREVEDSDVLFVASPGGAPDRFVREPFRGGAARLPRGDEHVTPLSALEVLLEFAAAGPDLPPAPEAAEPADQRRYRSGLGLTCRGERCVSAKRPDVAAPDFAVVGRAPTLLECCHCGARTEARFGASKLERRFHPIPGADAAKILPANLVLFRTRGEALAAGFEAARRRVEEEEASG